MPMDMMPLGDSPTPMSSAGAAGGAGMAVPSLQNGGAPAPQAGQPSGLESFMNQAGPGIAGIIAALGAKAMGNRSGPAARLAIGLEQARIQRARQQRQEMIQQAREKQQQRRQAMNDSWQKIQAGHDLGIPGKDQDKEIANFMTLSGMNPENLVSREILKKHPVFFKPGTLEAEDIVAGNEALEKNPGLNSPIRFPGVARWKKRRDAKMLYDQQTADAVNRIVATADAEADAAGKRATATATATADVKATGVGAEARVNSVLGAYELATGKPFPEAKRAFLNKMAEDAQGWQQNLSQFWKAEFPEEYRQLEFVQKWNEFETSFFGETGEIERRAIGEEIRKEMGETKPNDPNFESKLVLTVQRLASSDASLTKVEPIFQKLSPSSQRKAVGKFTAWILKNIYGQGMTDEEAAANFPGGG